MIDRFTLHDFFDLIFYFWIFCISDSDMMKCTFEDGPCPVFDSYVNGYGQWYEMQAETDMYIRRDHTTNTGSIKLLILMLRYSLMK